jgi:hypothetical protein
MWCRKHTRTTTARFFVGFGMVTILSTDGRQQHHTIIFIRLQTFSDHIKINKILGIVTLPVSKQEILKCKN